MPESPTPGELGRRMDRHEEAVRSVEERLTQQIRESEQRTANSVRLVQATCEGFHAEYKEDKRTFRDDQVRTKGNRLLVMLAIFAAATTMTAAVLSAILAATS